MINRNKYIYYATQLFHSLVFTIPIWIVYLQGRVTIPQISFLVTFEYMVIMAFELPSGALADLIGRKYTNLIGFLVGTVSYILFPFATQFWHFIVLLFMTGIMASFRSGSEEALLYDTFKQEDKVKDYDNAYANGNIIYQIGLIIATAAGGFLYEINNSIPYILYGISLFIGSIIVLFYIEPLIDSEKFTLKNYAKQIRDGSREVFKNQYTKFLSLFYIFVGGIGWSSTLFFNHYILIDLGFSDSLRGILTASMRFINVILISSLLKNQKIFNWQRKVVFFPLIMMFAYLPGVYLEGFWGLPFIQAAMIATTARWIILSPLTNAAFSSKYRATAISLLSLLIGVVYVSLTSISGGVIANFGIKTMYTILGVITLITVVPISIKLLKIQSVENTAELESD